MILRYDNVFSKIVLKKLLRRVATFTFIVVGVANGHGSTFRVARIAVFILSPFSQVAAHARNFHESGSDDDDTKECNEYEDEAEDLFSLKPFARGATFSSTGSGRSTQHFGYPT